MSLVRNVFKEVVSSTLPVTFVILILQIAFLHSTVDEILLFIGCIAMVIAGFTMFLYGVQIGINPIGSAIGSEIPKRRSKLFMIAVVFTISFLVTVAEPDVSVFAQQVASVFSSVGTNTLIYSIAAGVAAFLIIATLKIIYNISLKVLLTVSYGVVIILTLILSTTGNMAFLGIAFDSGGVTTGPMTVPVLLSLGIGICSVGASRTEMDGFGMIGLASIGPIIALLVIGIFSESSTMGTMPDIVNSAPLMGLELMLHEFKKTLYSVLTALIPLVLFFVLFQRIFLRYSWTAVKNMLIGIAIAGVGIVLFLTGVYTGFVPTATEIGTALVEKYRNGELISFWIICLGFVLGFLVAFAEPAVNILGDQVEKSSRGLFSKRHILFIISTGVAVFVAIGIAKFVYNIPFIWIIVPGYMLSIGLMLLSDREMVGIAFDAGGVATGPMSVAILLSLYVGISKAWYPVGSIDAVINGFGLVALIALAPTVFLSILGIITKHKKKKDREYYYE